MIDYFIELFNQTFIFEWTFKDCKFKDNASV